MPNKEIIQSIVTENILYTVTSCKDNLVRLTSNNVSIDFEISAARETMVALAKNHSIISILENYEEFGPTAVLLVH